MKGRKMTSRAISGRLSKPALVIVLAMLSLAGCADRALPAASAPHSWRLVATQADRGRIRDWRTAWVAAVARARAAGHGPAIDAEGVLLQPDTAIDGAMLPAGNYDCRVIKLGGKGKASLLSVSYPPFACRVAKEGAASHFSKLSGPQRPVGHLYPESGRRMIFLGSLMLGDETMAMRYGQDRKRDMAGILERIGPARWRLVFPHPQFESLLDVVELKPSK